jgi:hypothetical protein
MIATFCNRVANVFFCLSILSVVAIPLWGLSWIGYWGITGEHIPGADGHGDRIAAVWFTVIVALLIIAGINKAISSILNEEV